MKNKKAYSPKYLKMEAMLLYLHVGSTIPSESVPKKFLSPYKGPFFGGFSVVMRFSDYSDSFSSDGYWILLSLSNLPLSGSLINARIAVPIATPIPPIKAKVFRHPYCPIVMMEIDERAEPM